MSVLVPVWIATASGVALTAEDAERVGIAFSPSEFGYVGEGAAGGGEPGARGCGLARAEHVDREGEHADVEDERG